MLDRKRLRAIGVVAAVAMALTACGARVSPYFPTTQAASSSGGGQQGGSQSAGSATGASSSASSVPAGGGGSAQSAGGGGGAPQGGGGQTPTSPGAAQSSGPAAQSGPAPQGGSGGAGPVTVASLSPSNFSYNPQQQAAYCQGSGGNTASAPGVTPSTIEIGNVSGLTGAVSDSFTPGSQAVTAVFDAVNRYGGICGRQLKLDTQDDQQSATNNQNDVSFLIPKVFAFVGSLSDADNGGVNAMVSAGVPDMGPAINVNRSNSPVFWSATGGSVTVKNGQAYLNDAWIQGLKAYHNLPSSIAILAYNISISAQAAKEYAAVFQQAGVKLCYTNYSIPPAPGTVMGSVVSSMQSNNCGGVFTTMDVVGNADMLQDMQSDGYHPQLISTTYEGYTPDQISLAGQSAAQGLDVGLSSEPLTSQVPGVQLYQAELSAFEPGQPATEFGLEAWADAELFIYALLKAGRNPTRQSLVSALGQVTNWTSDGAFGAYTPSNRTGPPCTSNVVVSGNGFKQTWPTTGLFCQGHLVPVPSS